MRDGFGPDGAVGCRLTDESSSSDGTDYDDVIEAAGAVGATTGLADYISVTLGASSTYRGSTWIVPPSPAAVNAVAEFARPCKARVGGARDRHRARARSRRRRPPDRRGRLRRRRHDAGEIADPNLARQTRAGEPITRCIGCNQGCIGHYHAGVPIACTVNPWTGYERDACPARAPAETPGTVVVVGAGPAGCAAAASAAARGHRVVVLRARRAVGRPDAARARRARATPRSPRG